MEYYLRQWVKTLKLFDRHTYLSATTLLLCMFLDACVYHMGNIYGIL